MGIMKKKLSFGKNDKQKGVKAGKNLRNKSVRNLTLFLIRRECVYIERFELIR